MRWLVGLAGLLAIGAMPAPKPIARETIVTWTSAKGMQSWTAGGVTATLSAKGGREGQIVLTVAAPGMAPFRFVDGEGMANYETKIGIGSFGRDQHAGVLLQTYTGGAHCCVHVTAILPDVRGYRAVDFGEWDGDGIAWPHDRDGDGNADFVFGDNTFLYAFGSYADSWAPPLIMTIDGAGAIDVSTRRAFWPLYQADLAKARTACLKADPNFAGGPCAGYLADAARLNRFDAAWAEVAKTTIPAKAGFPNDCDEKPQPAPCYRDFATGVRAFLTEHGYLK